MPPSRAGLRACPYGSAANFVAPERMFSMGYDIDQKFQRPDMHAARLSQRRLPQVDVDGATYFINFNLAPGTPDLDEAERTIVFDALEFFHMKRYRLHATCVMNDHVHVVARLREGVTRSQVTHSWKSFTANRLQREHGRTFDVWQEESETRVLRNWFELVQKTVYTVQNPVERWPNIKDYRWMKFYGFDGAGADACPTIEALLETWNKVGQARRPALLDETM
jgi:REP element-mobilizing transposase RayT